MLFKSILEPRRNLINRATLYILGIINFIRRIVRYSILIAGLRSPIYKLS